MRWGRFVTQVKCAPSSTDSSMKQENVEEKEQRLESACLNHGHEIIIIFFLAL